jgi:hypothetical protein
LLGPADVSLQLLVAAIGVLRIDGVEHFDLQLQKNPLIRLGTDHRVNMDCRPSSVANEATSIDDTTGRREGKHSAKQASIS